MNNNQTDPVVLPFRQKPKEPSVPSPRYMSLQEFADETSKKILELENINYSLSYVTIYIERRLKEIEQKMRIVWIGACIGWGLVMGAILSYLIKGIG